MAADLTPQTVKAWAARTGRSLNAIAAELGLSYTQLWRNLKGEQPMQPDRAARLRAMMAEEAPAGGPSRDDLLREVQVSHHRTPLGDAVLVAVGRFEAIEEMAGELAKMAGRSGKELERAAREDARLHRAPPTPIVPAVKKGAHRKRRGGTSRP